MNSVSPYYVNLILSYSYFVCYCLYWVDTSLIKQFFNLTSPDFLSYPFTLTLDLQCNFVFRMEIRWWQTKLDVKTLIFKHLWAIDLHDQRPSSSSACIKPLTGHVTIYGSISRSNIQQVRWILLLINTNNNTSRSKIVLHAFISFFAFNINIALLALCRTA